MYMVCLTLVHIKIHIKIHTKIHTKIHIKIHTKMLRCLGRNAPPLPSYSQRGKNMAPHPGPHHLKQASGFSHSTRWDFRLLVAQV